MPINFRDEAGEWQPIDTELVASPGDRWAVENAAAAFEAKLPEDAAVDPVRFATDDGWVTVSMEGATGDPVVDDSSATYAATGAADAVEYQALNTGLKETVVLDDLPATAPVLEFSVETSAGLTPRLNDANEIEFVNAAEEVVFHTPAGWMSDSAEVPEESSDVAYDLEQTDTGWGLTVTPDWAWLSDPARMYPVRIDPTVMNPPRTWWGTAGSRKPPPVRSTARRPTR